MTIGERNKQATIELTNCQTADDVIIFTSKDVKEILRYLIYYFSCKKHIVFYCLVILYNI